MAFSFLGFMVGAYASYKLTERTPKYATTRTPFNTFREEVVLKTID